MSEQIPMLKRTPLHHRKIDVQGYLRDDGLWEIEGILADTKGYDIHLFDRGQIPVGGYLHYMTLTLIVDEGLVIKDVRARMDWTPHQDCPGAEPQYRALIGLRIKSGWMDEAKRAIGRATGCTHLTELLPVLATAAIQTIRGYRLRESKGYDRSESERGRMLNSCQGFSEGSRAQQHLWPELNQAER